MRSQRAAARKAASKFKQNASPTSDTDSSDLVSAPPSPSDSELSSASEAPSPPLAKRRKTTTQPALPALPSAASQRKKKPTTANITIVPKTKTTSTPLTFLHPPPSPFPPSIPPSRLHSPLYHHPLLLLSPLHRTSLLHWFALVHTTRSMPWRLPFLPPSITPPPLLSIRAYQVYISEIMLQQTRVATVISYYNRWMAKWPTIEDLAAATEEEVLNMWQGLGYYSRARRIHEAAKLVVGEFGGLIPGDVKVLRERVPGVGRYTAGAVAAIVYGKKEAMVDGNVVRVLARQMGLGGDVKEGRVMEGLWGVAGELVRRLVEDERGEEEKGGKGRVEGESEKPGMWGQALMELGSTVCTPVPKCGECPITGTCRVYQEGEALARGEKRRKVEDIEDLCTVCVPWEEDGEGLESEDSEEVQKSRRRRVKAKQAAVSMFFETSSASVNTIETATGKPDARTLEIIINHARKLPPRKPKKTIREEQIIVCAIRRSTDRAYLIRQRPDKGLLGGMWELPSYTLTEANHTIKSRQLASKEYVASLLPGNEPAGKSGKRKRKQKETLDRLHCDGEVAVIPWVFSHLKLTMHVHTFLFNDKDAAWGQDAPRSKWVSVGQIEKVTMGTGMRNCWEAVKSLKS